MGRALDLSEIKRPGDIIYRSSRPQRNSTYVPQKRDWRFETVIYQHDDFEDSVNDMTIWDQLDEDYILGTFGKERRRTKGSFITAEEKSNINVSMSLTSGSFGGSQGGTAMIDRTVSMPLSTPTMKSTTKTRKRSSAYAISYFRRTDAEDGEVSGNGEGEDRWNEMSLIVCLKFLTKTLEFQRIVEELSISSAIPFSLFPPSRTGTPSTQTSITTPTTTKSTSSVGTFPIFDHEWKDNTRPYSIAKLLSSIRTPEKDEKIEPIPPNYTWFRDAVPVDAIFPPGLPITAKEISAYYPHHLRWKGVALRYLNNGYRSADIIEMQSFFRNITPPLTRKQTTEHIRNALRTSIPNFSTTSFSAKPTKYLYTDGFQSNKLVELRGHSVPTFDNLLSGLTYLPTGLDARELTACLVWYLHHRNMFSPPLALNVLHVRELVHALRIPLKPYGPRNLDIAGLTEWRGRDRVMERKVADELASRLHDNDKDSDESLQDEGKRSKLRINVADSGEDGSVQVDVEIKIRHVLTFPFLAVQRLVGEALRMGIENGEQRRRIREWKTRRGLGGRIGVKGQAGEGGNEVVAGVKRIRQEDEAENEAEDEPLLKKAVFSPQYIPIRR